jgi:glyoxylase-like metal-dependent hydrolase (beta-lactamase superfamily II)
MINTLNPRVNGTGTLVQTEEIDPVTLREWLEEGKKVKVIDIRPKKDFEEWHIPGSENVDVYQDLYNRSPGELERISLPFDVPVVAVCYVGQTSKMAVNYLRSRGIKAMSLSGGMQWWSLAWNLAEVPVRKSPSRVLQVRRTGKGCLSYMVGSDGEAIVIDASVDPQIYVDLAKKNDWTIAGVLDTHIHADHLSRTRKLAELTGANLFLPRQDRAKFEHIPMDEGDILQVGAAQLEALPTPGHTPESMSFYLDEEAIFTGDTLFTNSVGRPDLKSRNQEEIVERAATLFRTLQMLRGFPPHTLILPGHTDKPVEFNRKPVSATLSDAIQDTRVLRYGFDLDEFTAIVLKSLPATPPNHMRVMQLNEAGALPDGDPTALEAGANRCGI